MIPLETIKAHLRVDGDEENDYLEGLATSAIEYAEKYTGMAFFETQNEVEASELANATVMGALLKRGCLLLIGHWYSTRESVNIGNIVQEIPLTSRAIFDMFRLPTL